LVKNSGRIQLKAKDIVSKRVLILGEVGSGKTLLASRLLKELMILFDPKEITVIDLAPQRRGEVGGKLSDYMDSIDRVRYLSPERVYTPRLTGTSHEQILNYAEQNRRAMEPLFNEFVQRTTKILILNDVTLYLHAGKLETVLKCMRLAETFLSTGYYGSRLAEDRGSGISVREKQLIEKLATYMDQIIELDR